MCFEIKTCYFGVFLLNLIGLGQVIAYKDISVCWDMNLIIVFTCLLTQKVPERVSHGKEFEWIYNQVTS